MCLPTLVACPGETFSVKNTFLYKNGEADDLGWLKHQQWMCSGFAELGKELGYTGEALRTFINNEKKEAAEREKQQIAREERAREREEKAKEEEHRRELERKDKEGDLLRQQKEAKEEEHRREMEKREKESELLRQHKEEHRRELEKKDKDGYHENADDNGKGCQRKNDNKCTQTKVTKI